MLQVFCVQLCGESVVLPDASEEGRFGFYRNEYVLTSSPGKAVTVAKERTLRKLAAKSIIPVQGQAIELHAEEIFPNMPLTRLLRNEGFFFYRTDIEE